MRSGIDDARQRTRRAGVQLGCGRREVRSGIADAPYRTRRARVEPPRWRPGSARAGVQPPRRLPGVWGCPPASFLPLQSLPCREREADAAARAHCGPPCAACRHSRRQAAISKAKRHKKRECSRRGGCRGSGGVPQPSFSLLLSPITLAENAKRTLPPAQDAAKPGTRLDGQPSRCGKRSLATVEVAPPFDRQCTTNPNAPEGGRWT